MKSGAHVQRDWQLTEFLTENDSTTDGLRAFRRTDGTSLQGCEQRGRENGARTDDQRRATDLAVGGSSPSRRAHFRRSEPMNEYLLLASLGSTTLPDSSLARQDEHRLNFSLDFLVERLR